MRISLIHLECINFQGSSEAAKLTFRTDRTLERKLNPTSSHLTGSAAAAQTSHTSPSMMLYTTSSHAPQE
ncbi:Protein of unknown function [Pyronema omphalodes CBS 100304]|uniref:Uncharacterized protein n=1 Tax=Pyronema omphalodes (strain CBS 100304) TaxID=1076935 RepID=U4L5V5_PYROM|nr:Protein of unknown function [Pyronema omphalodes CBS 100304]